MKQSIIRSCLCCSEQISLRVDSTDPFASVSLKAASDLYWNPSDDYDDLYGEDPYHDPYNDLYDDHYDDELDLQYQEDEEWEQRLADESADEAAEFINLLNGSNKAKRFDRRKKQSQKLVKKRPPAYQGMKKIFAGIERMLAQRRYPVEFPHMKNPLKTIEGE